MRKLGVQSFAEDNLTFLGRLHSPRVARRRLDSALGAGFDTVAMDLIYGLPEQTQRDWQLDLDKALAAGPHHLSCYQLTIHSRTPFGFRQARGQLRELGHEAQADLFTLTHRHLGENGLPGYEVSNFAAGPEHRSLHNQKYWSHTPYLGLGPSAHSFSGSQRWWNPRKIKAWMGPLAAGRPPTESVETLSPSSLVLESLMLGLRTYAGVDFENLPGGLGPAVWAENRQTIGELVERGLATVHQSRLQPTLAGLAVADTLARGFELSRLPDPSPDESM